MDSAIAAPESIDARKLIKQVWRVVKVTSRNVAWSPEEIKSGLAKMYNMNIMFNGPDVFLTFAPCEMHCKLSTSDV